MKIAVLCNTGPQAWLKQGAGSEGDMSLDFHKGLASTAERGKLDILFLADGVGFKTLGLDAERQEAIGNGVHFEPMTLLSALSQSTTDVGLVSTISSTYAHPYAIARSVGSLDFLSNGRAGWNVVTSGSDEEAFNYGLDRQLSSADRYRRANEAVDAVFGLWDSFDDDAFLRDRSTGRYFDHRRMHQLNHQGEFFKIRGPLNMPRPPQGRPLISQAGTSPEGHRMAARTADVMYAKYSTFEGGRQFREDMGAMLAAFGRPADQLVILPGFLPVIGGTEAEAKRKFMDIQQYLDDGAGLQLIKGFWGVDLGGYPLDEAIPDLPEIGHFVHSKTLDLDRNGKRMTVREAFHWLASAYGHLSSIGTPEQIADIMQAWFQEGGADGFNLFLHSMPQSLEDFVDEVVPILQNRGLMQRDYREGTLRNKLGLHHPASRYAELSGEAALG
jgi:alkanesulfonate monooxygenase